jgi:hypothetical protein
VFETARGNCQTALWKGNLTLRLLPYSHKKLYFPDSTGRLTEPDFRIDEYQRQKIARRFGVSLATAGTIIAMAGFADGERR